MSKNPGNYAGFTAVGTPKHWKTKGEEQTGGYEKSYQDKNRKFDKSHGPG